MTRSKRRIVLLAALLFLSGAAYGVSAFVGWRRILGFDGGVE